MGHGHKAEAEKTADEGRPKGRLLGISSGSCCRVDKAISQAGGCRVAARAGAPGQAMGSVDCSIGSRKEG